ncbi:MAG: esterase [Sulfurimonas sp.]|nr:MAG: esterase [Sulfurimonas sp.]
MVIYIHGFGSNGFGSKAKSFRKYFKSTSETFIAPSLSYIPELAITTLEELIESYDGDVKLIGSSLGGFYSIYLANKYNLRTVLINPSIYPYVTLKKVLGDAPSFYDDSTFTWTESHIEMLKKYEVKVQNQSNLMLLVQKGDELLDFQEAVDKLPDSRVVIEDGGSHGFEGIERYFDEVRSFLRA